MATQKDLEVGEVVDTYEGSLEAGYFGVKVDPMPNEIYTVEGAATRKDELFKKADNKHGVKPAPTPHKETK